MVEKIDLRGRPTNSQIRKNLVDLLYFLRQGYGYQLYKKYLSVFDQKVNIRSIYYHLNKGVELGEFQVSTVEEVSGDYSWGDQVKRVVFSLGPNASPRNSPEILEKLKQGAAKE